MMSNKIKESTQSSRLDQGKQGYFKGFSLVIKEN